MLRPWPVAAILIITILAVIITGYGTIYTLRQADAGVLDPLNQATATSTVHLFLVFSRLALNLIAAIALFLLRKSATLLFTGALVLQLADLVYLWVTLNNIAIDLTLILIVICILYSFSLSRRGVLI